MNKTYKTLHDLIRKPMARPGQLHKTRYKELDRKAKHKNKGWEG